MILFAQYSWIPYEIPLRPPLQNPDSLFLLSFVYASCVYTSDFEEAWFLLSTAKISFN